MKKSRFTSEGILKEHHAGLSAVDLCRKRGFSGATFYKWRAKYGCMDLSDAMLRQRLRELTSERRRFGYRSLHLLLEKQGVIMNRKKLHRLYAMEKLAVRKRGGRKFRMLCDIFDFSRECLTTIVDNSLTGIRVAPELNAIAMTKGYPCVIVSDNGTELTSNATLG